MDFLKKINGSFKKINGFSREKMSKTLFYSVGKKNL